jgi:hypothetical protein
MTRRQSAAMNRSVWPALLAPAFLFALAGCGGGSLPAARDAAQPQLIPVASNSANAERPRRAFAPPARIEQAQPATTWPVAVSDEPSFTVADRFGRTIGSFDLSPVIGRGYEELTITVMARKVGQALPPEAVRPACREDAQCTYEMSKPYSLTLSDDTAMKLVPRGDGVALVARTMKLDAPTSVEVVFAQGEQVIARKKVTLLAELWKGKPM